jgi:hypothetical protein
MERLKKTLLNMRQIREDRLCTTVEWLWQKVLAITGMRSENDDGKQYEGLPMQQPPPPSGVPVPVAV